MAPRSRLISRGTRARAAWRRRRARSSARRGRAAPARAASPPRGRRACAGRARAGAPACRRNGSRSSSSRKRARLCAVAGRPGRGRCGAAARTSRSAAGPTRAGSRWPNIAPIRRASSMRCRDGSSPATRDVPGRRDQDPGQHLDRRRLAGAVRPEVADQLAALDAERDVRSPPRRRARSRRKRPRADDELLRELARPRSSAGAPVVAHGEPPDEPGDARGDERRRAARRTRASAAGRAGRACRGCRAPGSSRRTRAARGRRGSAAASAVDVDRVLRQEVAAVGERVRELAAVGRPEARHAPTTQTDAKMTIALGSDRRASIATRPASSGSCSAASA